MNKIYFATGNKGKAQEAQFILGLDVEIADIELYEIQELDLKKIVEHKVIQAYEKLQKPVCVDDVSLEIDVWKGFPGPFIKFLREAGGNELLLYMLRNEENRKATLVSTIAFHDGKSVHIFEGRLLGQITKTETGERGWGFDPIFIPDGMSVTFAQMSEEEKNTVSHRRLAMNKFKEYLDSQTNSSAL